MRKERLRSAALRESVGAEMPNMAATLIVQRCIATTVQGTANLSVGAGEGGDQLRAGLRLLQRSRLQCSFTMQSSFPLISYLIKKEKKIILRSLYLEKCKKDDILSIYSVFW